MAPQEVLAQARKSRRAPPAPPRAAANGRPPRIAAPNAPARGRERERDALSTLRSNCCRAGAVPAVASPGSAKPVIATTGAISSICANGTMTWFPALASCARLTTLEAVPAEAAAQDPGRHLERLHPVDRHDHVGAGQQAAAAAQALGRLLEPEAVIAQHRAAQAGDEADDGQQRQARSPRRSPGPRSRAPASQWPGPASSRSQRLGIPDIERQQEIELLRRAAEHREDDQRELEQAEVSEALQVHREQRARSALRRGAAVGSGAHGLAALEGAHRLAQRRAFGL